MNINMSKLSDKMFEAFSFTAKNEYIYICDLASDLSRWSKSAIEFFGLPDEYMYGADKIWEAHIHPDDRQRYREQIDMLFSGEIDVHDMDYRAADKNGNYVMCTCKGVIINDEKNQPAFFAGTITNHGVIDNIDPNTNLYNLYEFLNQVKRLRETKKESIVLLIGLKHFSDINDVYGYTFGNMLIKQMATYITELVKGRGITYRMDGARFAVITTQMSIEEIKQLYHDIQDVAKHKLSVNGSNITIGVSGGAALVKDFEMDEHSVHASVRYAFDKSKNEKHSELVIVQDDYLDDNKKSIELINEMRRCISDNCKGFYLCYQPVVSSLDGKLIGMEALLRWRSERYGEVPPGIFIPWIEKDALFFELGNWILRQAMTDGKEFLQDHPDIVVNVNLSYAQLERTNFRNSLLSIIEETGFPASNLCLEITERCSFLDLKFLRNEVIFLKSYGIKIALDDFGTGFSSLNLLRELPVDIIKIDRGFVSDIENNPIDQSIVKAVTQCAKELSIHVCVEGIENEELVEYMKNYPSTSYQGYYYSRPVRKEDFKKLTIYNS